MTLVIHHNEAYKHPPDKLVYIGRPSIYGNPFKIGVDGTREEVIEKFKAYFRNRVETDHLFRFQVEKLKDKVLVCFCKPQDCHGDVYVEYLDN